MTTHHFPHPSISSHNTIAIIVATVLIAAAFSIGRYQREDGAVELPRLTSNSSSPLSPSWVAPAPMTEGAWIAEHDAAITGVLGIAPSTALEPSLVTPAPMTEAEWLAEHDAAITGVLGVAPSTALEASLVSPAPMTEAAWPAEHDAAIDDVLGLASATAAYADALAR